MSNHIISLPAIFFLLIFVRADDSDSVHNDNDVEDSIDDTNMAMMTIGVLDGLATPRGGKEDCMFTKRRKIGEKKLVST